VDSKLFRQGFFEDIADLAALSDRLYFGRCFY